MKIPCTVLVQGIKKEKMNKMIMSGLWFLVSKFLQVSAPQGNAEDVTKLKVAAIYLHVVKISRLLLISLFGSGVCLLLLFLGLMLINLTVLFYAPWEVSTKVIVTLVCAGAYILVAVGIFVYVFSEDKWMKMFNTEAMVDELTKGRI